MGSTERKIIWRFLALGFLFPCLLFSVMLIDHVEVGGGDFTWMLFVPWPTFIMVMSAEAGGGAAGEFLAFIMSALANAVLYGIVGVVVAAVYRRVAQSRARSRT
jgi:hypothetical protein